MVGPFPSKVYEHTITQEWVNQFAEASGDKNPLHVDPVYAGLTKFGKTMAHGVAILSLISKHIAEDFGKDGRSPILVGLHVEFMRPAFVGEKIWISFLTEKVVGKNREWVVVVTTQTETILKATVLIR